MKNLKTLFEFLLILTGWVVEKIIFLQSGYYRYHLTNLLRPLTPILLLMLSLWSSSPIYAAWQWNQGGWINLDVDKSFSLIFGGSGTSVKGDFYATGNTIMDGDKNTSYFAESTPHMIQADSEIVSKGTKPQNQNASSAPLHLPPYVRAKDIVWAGLFWQGQIHENANSTNDVDTQVEGWNRVRLRTPDGIIHEINASIDVKNQHNTTYHYAHFRGGHYRFFYSAYVDVTDIIKTGGYDENHTTVTVGNIMATDGYDQADYIYFNHINEPQGSWYNGLHMGHFGGWSLVVVYDVDSQTIQAHQDEIKLKNISIYNGYDLFSFWTGHAGDEFTETVHLSGFRTPSSGPISSKMIFFGGGGDYGMDHDSLQIDENATGVYKDLSNLQNTGTQKFNGTYSKMDGSNIIPGKSYFQGMDLDEYNTSAYMAHAQMETHIKFGVVQQQNYIDQVFPQMIAFSTQLYEPKLCYEYNVRLGDYVRVPSKNREVNVTKVGDLPLKLKILLRSQEADYNFNNAKVRIVFNNDENISDKPKEVQVSPPNINGYIDVDTNASDFFPIGRGVTEGSTDPGGIIRPLESNYISTKFDFNDTVNTTFEIEVDTEINFGPSTVPYHLSTRGSISKCPSNPVYDPIWGQFNVERTDSGTYDPGTQGQQRYSLYTQITGRNYNVSLVRYNPADLSEEFSDQNDTVVEVELIDAGVFENNSTLEYDSTCEEPSYLGQTRHGAFKNLNGNSRVSVHIPSDLDGYHNEIALKNAAFRMWVLTRETNATTGGRTIIHHNCTDPGEDNTCFIDLYNNTIHNYDTQNYCGAKCSDNNNTECYDCLRKYFATPICSRDNFAIRPYGFRVFIGDNNESSSTSVKKIVENRSSESDSAHPIPLATGYHYSWEINATMTNGAKSTGYYNYKLLSNDDYSISPSDKTRGNIAILEFMQQSDSCTDKRHKSLGLQFTDSKLSRCGNYFSSKMDCASPTIQANAGYYTFWVSDHNWTAVDQKDSGYKPQFPPSAPQDDCILYSSAHPANGKVGCLTTSSIPGDSEYSDLHIRFEPYRFNMDVGLKVLNSTTRTWLYMNDLNDTGRTPDYRMAVKIEGNITAQSKEGDILTNFTRNCAAEDVRLWLTRTMLPVAEFDINDTNGTHIPFQQVLRDSDGLYHLSGDNNISDLQKSNFIESDRNGTAKIDIYYNFQKGYQYPINPVDVNFSTLIADSPSAASHTEMRDDYIPDGNHTMKEDNNSIGQERWFYYARVAPAIGTDGRQIYTPDTTTTTTLHVNVFCVNRPGINCPSLTGLSSAAEEGDWYRMEDHLSSNGDGNITELNTTVAGIVINGGTNRETNQTRLAFDSNGSTSPITISYPPTAPRPVHPVFVITPDEWLKYNADPSKNGLPEFILHFLSQGLKWKGTGKTGHVIETEPTIRPSKRLNW